MMHFSVYLSPKTQDKKASELKVLLAEFFEQETIDEAVAVLNGKWDSFKEAKNEAPKNT